MAKSKKPSATRKVAKVARTGGGRTTGRNQSSFTFPLMISTICVIGLALIVVSRQDRQPDTTPPRIGDHWHSAIGFDICGTFTPSIPDSGQDPLGIHTHGDGIVHTHPFGSQATGRRATLSKWFDAVGIEVTENSIKIPNQEKSNGDSCETGGEGKVRVKVWETRDPSDEGVEFEGDPGDIRLGNNQLITVAFLADGAEIRKPPTEAELDRLSDVPGATTTTVAGATTTTEATTTTAPTTTTTTP